MRFPGLSGIQRIRFANAIRSRALEEPIVDAVGRHFYVPAEAVTVLGVEYRTVPDDSADPGGRALTESTDVVMSLELRESTEMVNVTAARASVPLDMQNLWRLRADLLGHGAFELGIDVDALEIVWDEAAVQIDTHAPTPAPTPPPTPANATGAPDEVSNAGIFSYLMGSLPGGQDSSVGIGVLASFGALLVCGATYAAYVRVQHPRRQKGALSAKARQGDSGAANYAPELVRDVYSLLDVASSGSLKDAKKWETDEKFDVEKAKNDVPKFYPLFFSI